MPRSRGVATPPVNSIERFAPVFLDDIRGDFARRHAPGASLICRPGRWNLISVGTRVGVGLVRLSFHGAGVPAEPVGQSAAQAVQHNRGHAAGCENHRHHRGR